LSRGPSEPYTHDRARTWLRSYLAPFAGLALVSAILFVWGLAQKPDDSFFTAYRLSLVAKQSAIVGMGALGMTLVIAAGGIDLSIGSLCALCSVVMAVALNGGSSPGFALLATVAAGAIGGAFNGRLLTLLRLPPFIATLGTMLVFRGVAEHVAGQSKIPAEPPRWIAALLDPPASSGAPLVCTAVWVVIAAGIVLAFVMRRTVFGRHVLAVGSNEDAARVCGVRVNRVKILVYAIGGACAGAAGLFTFVDVAAQGDPTSGYGLELDVIAAVVIGGGSLSGGRGSVLGSLAGALLMSLITSGCTYAELSDSVQKIVTGVLLVTAVALDRSRRDA
jgi:ribose/xylose/arabinose/galactoside ABC-type transport system permease subunit